MRLVRWVALYTPAVGKTGGRVAWIAPVQETRQARRSDLKTPWAPSRSPDEQVIVFELGELSQLPRPIENPSGLRMPPYRWATYLALSRARDISELAIETVPEWRLHQQLLAEGVPFSVRSGHRLHASSDEHGKGAAIFHMANDATIRHQPKRGYKIRWADGREVEALSVDDALTHFRSALRGA